MLYCTKCGKQNPDTAKFCTGCGADLMQNKPVANSPVAGKSSPNKDAFPVKKRRVSSNTLLLGGIFLVGSLTAVYFIFLNKKKEPTEVTTAEINDANTKPTTTTSSGVSDPAPLKPGTQNNKLTISQNEVDNVSRRIDEFYRYEKDEDVTNLLSYYHFPLDRYYQIYNVGYEKLHKMVIDAFNGSLYYHNINIKWDSSSVQKLGSGGYKALLFAEYTSASQADDNRKSQNLHLTIIMNDNYEITSIYPN